jgi:hypothetical protein
MHDLCVCGPGNSLLWRGDMRLPGDDSGEFDVYELHLFRTYLEWDMISRADYSKDHSYRCDDSPCQYLACFMSMRKGRRRLG